MTTNYGLELSTMTNSLITRLKNGKTIVILPQLKICRKITDSSYATDRLRSKGLMSVKA